MGHGLSRVHHHHHVVEQQQTAAAALVIAADGSLREFSSSVSVDDVLGCGNADLRRVFFLCSSDAFYFGEDVPALGGGEILRPGQVYFVLPTAMLGRPLSSADMAKLAVRASEALLASTTKPAARGRGDNDVDGGEVNEKLNERTLGECVTASPPRSGGSKIAAAAAAAAPARRPPKRSLATIEEDAE